METSHNVSHHSTPQKFWKPSCIKYSILTVIAIGAISCIIFGGIGYSGAGLKAIGTSGSLAMITTGSAVLSTAAVVLYLARRSEGLFVPSYDDAQQYEEYLSRGEFFVYQGNLDNAFKMMLRMRHKEGNGDLGVMYYQSEYNTLVNLGYRTVSLEELKQRAKQ